MSDTYPQEATRRQYDQAEPVRDLTVLEVLEKAATTLHNAENELSNAQARYSDAVEDWHKAKAAVTEWIGVRDPDGPKAAMSR